MLTVHGQQHHFRHTNGCSCECVKAFETENASIWEGLEPPTFGFMPNALTIWVIRTRHLLSHFVEHWLWCYRYFEVKLTFWNINCAREMLSPAVKNVVCSHATVHLWFHGNTTQRLTTVVKCIMSKKHCKNKLDSVNYVSVPMTINGTHLQQILPQELHST